MNTKPWTLQFTIDKQLAVVFKDEAAREQWDWLFYDLLKMHCVCFGNYYNAFVFTNY